MSYCPATAGPISIETGFPRALQLQEMPWTILPVFATTLEANAEKINLIACSTVLTRYEAIKKFLLTENGPYAARNAPDIEREIRA
ncbi:hypothetical protein ACHAPJ_003415 [Fusarium lateritium]